MSETNDATHEAYAAAKRRWAQSPERDRAEQEALRMWPKDLHLGKFDGIMVSPEQSLAGQRQAFEMGVEFCLRWQEEEAGNG